MRFEMPRTVLIVDDHPSFRHSARAILEAEGFTVVGEAEDGIEAIKQVARHYPDTVLLDIEMPRLDGFAAAEVIHTFLPQTRLILHTARPDDAKRRRAEQLGLPLLDKMSIPATMEMVEESAVAAKHALALDIEPLVQLALAGRANEGVVIVKVDRTIPFYDLAVASVLDLPVPPERVTLDELHGRRRALRADGSVYPLEAQPVVRAMTERRAVSDCVYLRVPDGTLCPYTMTSLPLLSPNGQLLGVANSITDATKPGQALRANDPLLASV